MISRTKQKLAAALTAFALVAAPGASASDKRHELDALRRAVERGEVQPLASILESVRGKLPGEVTRIEAEQKKDRWIYELRVVDPSGRLIEVHVDAKTGDIIRLKDK